MRMAVPPVDTREACSGIRRRHGVRPAAPGSSSTLPDSPLICHRGRVSLYDDLGGFDVLLRFCRRWHELCLADPVAAHPFESEMHPHHDERLAAYLAEATGGPELYSAGLGDETSMRRMHAGQGSSEELNDACLRLFDVALAEVEITGDAGRRLSDYFRAATASFDAYAESRELVPENLPFNKA